MLPLLQQLQAPPHVMQVALAGRREPRAARIAGEQRRAYRTLDRRDARADRGLGQPEPGRGAAEAALGRDGIQQPEVVHIHRHSL
jgi:hypothetical protein